MRTSRGTAQDWRKKCGAGTEVKKAAHKELAEFYPADPDGRSHCVFMGPDGPLRIPKVRSRASIAPVVLVVQENIAKTRVRVTAKAVKGKIPSVSFEIFEPANDRGVRGGTVSRAKATCACCGGVLHPDRVGANWPAQSGGADVLFDTRGSRIGGATLLAVVVVRNGESGRHYRIPTDADYQAVWKAQQRLKEVVATEREDGLNPIPDEEISYDEIRRISVPLYGMKSWGDLLRSTEGRFSNTCSASGRKIRGLGWLIAARARIGSWPSCRPAF